MFRQTKLRTLLLVSILSLILVSFSVAIGVVSFKARNIVLQDAKDIAEEMGKGYGWQVAEQMNNAMATADSLGVTLEGIVRAETKERETVNQILKNTLENNPLFFGVWTCWEPGAFDDSDEVFRNTPGHDDTGRFIPYWFRSENSIDLTYLEGYDQKGTGDYYQMARNSGKKVMLEPFSYEVEGREVLMTTVTVPIIIENNVVGAVGIDISLDILTTLVKEIRPYEIGYATLLSNNGTVLGDGVQDDNENSVVGKNLSDLREADEALAVTNGKLLKKTVFSNRFQDNMFRVYVPIDFGSSFKPWSMNINIPEKIINAKAQTILTRGAIVGIVALLLITLVILMLAKRIVTPISLAVEKMKQVARGDLTQKIDQNFKIYEITQLKEAINTMIGDISGSVMEIRRISDELGSRAEELSAASEESTAAIQEVTSLTGETAAMTQEAATSVEETNASAEEISSGAQSAAQSASEAGENASQISSAASEGEKELDGMVTLIDDVERASRITGETISELSSSVLDISSFIEIISQIADQTNLLALNAAIEAARAGDAGRGFAVVAEEVRKLAEESNGAASKVEKVIGEISARTKNAIENQNEAGEHIKDLVLKAGATRKTIQEVVGKIVAISDGIQIIAATMEEQSASTEEMTSAMENISNVSQKSARSVDNINISMEEQGKVAETISQGSEELVNLSQRMQEAVVKFEV